MLKKFEKFDQIFNTFGKGEYFLIKFTNFKNAYNFLG